MLSSKGVSDEDGQKCTEPRPQMVAANSCTLDGSDVCIRILDVINFGKLLSPEFILQDTFDHTLIETKQAFQTLVESLKLKSVEVKDSQEGKTSYNSNGTS